MYGTDWTEIVSPDEEPRFTRIAERIAAVQAGRNAHHGEKARALHRQAHGGVAARFEVRPDLAEVLPTELHVGPFLAGASYDAYLRFSSGSSGRAAKDADDIRGLAIKLLGVPGPKCMGAAETQDFLLNQTATSAIRTPEEFVALVEAAAPGGLLGTVWRFGNAVGWGRALTILRAHVQATGVPFSGFASGAYFSMVPYRLGPTAARWSVVAADPCPSAGGGLTADLATRLREGARWTFRVQLYADAQRTPIEDGSVDWDTPWIDVATLSVAPTDAASDAARAVAAYVETLSFDPWHSCEALRPLGAFNRARKAAYYAGSTRHRTVIEEAEVRASDAGQASG